MDGRTGFDLQNKNKGHSNRPSEKPNEAQKFVLFKEPRQESFSGADLFNRFPNVIATMITRTQLIKHASIVKVALLLEYDGTDFSGWQVQENGRSVQGDLEAAFRQFLNKKIPVHGAGRTDAGVHARGMVAHVELPDELSMTLPKLTIALNATTATDIAVHDVRQVPADFHARHSATARQYRYTIRQARTAIDRNVVWSIHRAVDLEKIEAVTAMLVGEHDFTSFSKRSNDVEHYRCIVEAAYWTFHGTTFALTLRANRFVRGMVRALTGAIVQVGQSALSVDEFQSLLEGPQDFARAKYLAPAHGLVLEGVSYPERFGLWQI